MIRNIGVGMRSGRCGDGVAVMALNAVALILGEAWRGMGLVFISFSVGCADWDIARIVYHGCCNIITSTAIQSLRRDPSEICQCARVRDMALRWRMANHVMVVSTGAC